MRVRVADRVRRLAFVVTAACAHPRPSPAPPAVAARETVIAMPEQRHPDGNGAYRLVCTEIAGATTPAIDCDEQACALAFRADRVERDPSGYRVLEHGVAVERAADRWRMHLAADTMDAEIRDPAGAVLVVHAYLGDAGGSEASVTRTYYGIASSPDAEVHAFDGVATAGAAHQPATTALEYRHGVECSLRQSFLE